MRSRTSSFAIRLLASVHSAPKGRAIPAAGILDLEELTGERWISFGFDPDNNAAGHRHSSARDRWPRAGTIASGETR